MSEVVSATKTCNLCHLDLPLLRFHLRDSKANVAHLPLVQQRKPTCIECSKARLETNRETVVLQDEMQCIDCKKTKPIADFELTAAKRPRKSCKSCRHISRKASSSAKVKSKDSTGAVKPTQCIKCGKGPDEVEFRFRADMVKEAWRNECNSCINEKKYYAKYREKKLAENPEEFRRHNAEIHLEWTKKNPEAVKLQQEKTATIPSRRIRQIMTSAKSRNIFFQEAVMSVLQERLKDECFYCKFVPGDKVPLNGLDRVDPGSGFTEENTVACCATCNNMKGPFSIDEFIMNVRKIQKNREVDIDAPDIDNRYRLPAFGGRADLRAAPSKDKKDFLSINEKVDLWSANCYLCGRSPALGIDRMDAAGDYTLDNSRPCCTDCNYMKKDTPLDEFLKHIGYVVYHTQNWVLRDISDEPFKTCGGVERRPIAVTGNNDDTLLIFPSVYIAAKIMNVPYSTLNTACAKEVKVFGFRLKLVDHRAYRLQSVRYEIVKEFLMNCK